MRQLIENMGKFREFLVESGLAHTVVPADTPRTLSLPAKEETSDPQLYFSAIILEPEITAVSRDLFASGHFSLAIQEAFKALEKYLQKRVGIRQSGTILMDQIFSPNKPKLQWTGRLTQSEIDEQAGYHRLFAGASIGIRNPCTHEFNWVDDPQTALDVLLLLQHLLRKAKTARLPQ